MWWACDHRFRSPALELGRGSSTGPHCLPPWVRACRFTETIEMLHLCLLHHRTCVCEIYLAYGMKSTGIVFFSEPYIWAGCRIYPPNCVWTKWRTFAWRKVDALAKGDLLLKSTYKVHVFKIFFYNFRIKMFLVGGWRLYWMEAHKTESWRTSGRRLDCFGQIFS